jgi:hypothetical protein
MKIETKSRPSLMLPVIASLACTASLGLIGIAGPVFKQMFEDFEIDPEPIHLKIVQSTHWGWTIPLALTISALLIAGSRRWSTKTNLTVFLVAIVLAATVFMGFALMAFLPIFD